MINKLIKGELYRVVDGFNYAFYYFYTEGQKVYARPYNLSYGDVVLYLGIIEKTYYSSMSGKYFNQD